MIWYRVTTRSACGAVSTDHRTPPYGIITDEWTAPIFRAFVGQPLDNLARWAPVLSIELSKDSQDWLNDNGVPIEEWPWP